ncbi:type I methionyl aminopeptidase [Candidatus Kuenenbacteria bacterium HGW-Kuenenbacteria-1]|uniref:Methionine aminopeptidase n=1 Tax=Candidatus Kuenenbacteria bacterium HGW-Kuenenbacteria-1 TaxID=2013812 RepID=A0A2N1UN87_9BACT|nr:MAG: type I methionyl aminopeptidase [Candidatus Kuenenbacteria bacterium HGW-Kuenenbacteria-1]
MVYSKKQIELIRKSGKILAYVLNKVAKATKIGISSKELDELAEKIIINKKASPAFKGYDGFPASLCVSINENVVHGIPTKDKILKQGDIVGLDLGVKYNGFFTDMATTVIVGKTQPQIKKMVEVTKKALELGIKQAKIGNTVGDIGKTIQFFVEKNGFSVIRQLTGHGVGLKIHEDPKIPNFTPSSWENIKLKEGMVLAIEPMVAMGDFKIKTLNDNWTIAMADKSLSAHFEHTIVVTKKGGEILTK